MQIVFEVEESGTVTRTATCEAAETDRIKHVAERVAGELALDAIEIAENLGVGDVRFDIGITVEECAKHGSRWRHRRECVELRFETEVAKHHFPANAHWKKVHQWGCKHFNVAHDACANLELHEGAPNGPALNDAKELGRYEGCKIVWLVKPGPENNGTVERKTDR
jgi:hypothetical protein